MNLINLLLITIIIVIIIDLSGFIDSVKYFIAKMLKIQNYKNIHLKPFDCSFCSNFWISLIYIILINQLTLFNIAFILFLSFMTENIKALLILIKDIITKIIDLIYELL